MSDIQRLTDGVAAVRLRETGITDQSKAATERLKVLEQAIPEAIAAGDAVQTAKLRSERLECESVLRDSEAAERLVRRELEAAEHELAKARYPEVRKQTEAARDRLEESVQAIGDHVQRYLDAHREFLRVRNRTHDRDAEDRPTENVPLRTRQAAAVLQLYRDSFGVT